MSQQIIVSENYRDKNVKIGEFLHELNSKTQEVAVIIKKEQISTLTAW